MGPSVTTVQSYNFVSQWGKHQCLAENVVHVLKIWGKDNKIRGGGGLALNSSQDGSIEVER